MKSELLQGQWPTVERQKQEGGIAVEGVGLSAKDEVITLRARAKYPTKLHRYQAQYNLLTIEERDAGLRYGQLYERTGWMPLFPVAFTRLAPGGGGHDWTLSKIAAQATMKACEALLAREERGVVRLVCGYDEFVNGRGWRERQQNAQYLKTGLGKLVNFVWH
jgi:hypothetical protein